MAIQHQAIDIHVLPLYYQRQEFIKPMEVKEKRKTPKAFRLSDNAESLLVALSERLGVNQTAVVELAIRDKAKSEGVSLADSAKEAVKA